MVEPESEQSDDSMNMEVDRADNSDFDVSDVPPPTSNKRGTTTATTRGVKITTGTGRGKKATTAKASTVKKVTGRTREKAVIEESDESVEVIGVGEEEEEEEVAVPVKSNKRTNRAAVLRFVSISRFFLYVRFPWMLTLFD